MRVLGSFPRLPLSPVLGISGVYRGYARPTGLCGPMTTLPRCNPQRSEGSFRQSLRSVRWGFFASSIHCPTRNWMICRLTLPRVQRPTLHLWKYGKDRTEGGEGSHENSHAPLSLLLILHRSTTELSFRPCSPTMHNVSFT